MVKEHLKQSSREIERGRVTEIFEDAKVLVDEIGFKMSKNEVGHINESLKTNLFQHPNYWSNTTSNWQVWGTFQLD